MEFRDDEDPDELGKSGEALVIKYMEEAAPQIEPAAVEMRVEGMIAGVKVTGYIDLLDVDGCVIDIKTAKARPTNLSPCTGFRLPPTVAYRLWPGVPDASIRWSKRNRPS